jgi:hypothetical protein
LQLRRGISSVVSAMILTSILLIIMIVTTGIATAVLQNELVSSEFDSSKNLMKSVESELNILMYKPGGSTAIKNSYTYSSLGYTKTQKVMNVTFSGKDPFHVKLNYFNIESMPGVGGSFNYTLQGSDDLIIPSYLGDVGRIYISKPYNWRVSLDYDRALYTNTGISKLYNGTDIAQYNTFDVYVAEMNFDTFEYTGSSLMVLKNKSIDTTTFSLSGDWKLKVTIPNSESKEMSLTEMGGDPAYPTLIKFHKINLIINSIRGA